MIKNIVGEFEERRYGVNRIVTIDYKDLAVASATTTLTIAEGLGVGHVAVVRGFWLETAFDGGATSALKLDVGFNGATVDDADAWIDNVELHADGTEVFAVWNGFAGPVPAVDSSTVDTSYGQQEADVITSLRTLANATNAARTVAFQEAADIEAVFTATGGNLNVLTQGRIHIFLEIVDIRKLVRV